MHNSTFLTETQIWGSSSNQTSQLEIFKKYGTRAALTDFSIILGAYVSDFYTSEGNNLKDRTGWYWTKTSDGHGDARVVGRDGNKDSTFCNERRVAVRPALTFSNNPTISTNLVRGALGLDEIEYGKYPQTIANNSVAQALEQTFNSGYLTETGLEYTVNSRKSDEYSSGFSPIKLKEYEYNGENYVRIMVNSHTNGDEVQLSDGKKYKNGDYVWVKVEPIKWFKEPGKDYYVSKKCLYAGVRFDKENGKYDDSKFEQTEINTFHQTYFSKEIVETRALTFKDADSSSKQEQINPYEFDFDEVSEEDIIEAALKSGVAVFLHGPSSEGKSSRIKQKDPTCEIVSVGTLTPELLVGVAIKDNDQKIVEYKAPPWYDRLKKRCEQEPDKMHILFLDELTNATPNMQKYAYSIALDRKVNDFFELPENARVAAAGNEMEDSLAANRMPAPLFNRFAHVYIKTTVNGWLKWATKANIHPSIIKFIAYGGERVLRSEYNGKTPNADPRKWEMASKILYQTNNPMMLRALVGIDLTNEFCAFCRLKLVTLDDVLTDNYNVSVFSSDIATKFAITSSLIDVDEENLEKVREFVCKLGKDQLQMFDSLWIKDDLSRRKKIAMLRLESQAINSTGGALI